ncbi:recombination protein RecR [PVC group bacterium (ex Bugula neritina AB1)]|nr:recombination protein RecR [PVC group bacterium (ex Bugula neritina AB1)]
MDSPSIEALIKSFSKMPLIGSRMAERLALHITKMKEDDLQTFLNAISSVRQNIKRCKQCYHLSEKPLCHFCSNTKRDSKVVCVVESSSDLLSIEKTKFFQGLYHVLDGTISPLDGIGPSHINLGALMNRLKNSDVEEIILATNPTSNGEATATYITKSINSLKKNIVVSRIGLGIAMGSELSYVDKFSLTRSLQFRTKKL